VKGKILCKELDEGDEEGSDDDENPEDLAKEPSSE